MEILYNCYQGSSFLHKRTGSCSCTRISCGLALELGWGKMGGPLCHHYLYSYIVSIIYQEYKHNCHAKGSLGVLLLDALFTIWSNCWTSVTWFICNF